jgi:glutamate-1-semialdehyde 2,1-aminomutase
MATWELTDADREMIAHEVEPFLPDKIFDAHAHLLRRSHFGPGAAPAYMDGNPDQLGLAEYLRFAEWIHPRGRTVGGLFFGLAFTGDRDGNNRFVADEVSIGRGKGSISLGQLVVPPEMDPEQVREQVRRGGYVGLKCYHTLARVAGPTWNAPIERYLSEEHVRIAHEERLTITLHIVRDRALADPLNQATIRRYCERYSDMRLILAHAGRGFNPWHTIEGIESLQGLPNVWFDTSAVTEAGAFEAIVETIGPERLMYGSDFPISHLRGRCVAIGDSFHWFYAEDMDLDERHTTLRPVLVGLESLRSLRLAARRLRLKDSQVEDLFFGNAARLFGFA